MENTTNPTRSVCSPAQGLEQSPSPLDARIAAEIETAQAQIRQFQREAEQSYEAIHDRYKRFLKVARRTRRLVQVRLETLARRFTFTARPTFFHAEHRFQGAVACSFPSELAQVMLRFSLSHDGDLLNVYLDYDLELLPIYVKYTPHERLEQPLDNFDEAAVARWLDDRVVDFVRTFLQIPLTEAYQREHMVTDPIANVRFPRSFARMKLDFKGKTFYFISDETCWEFERRNGIGDP